MLRMATHGTLVAQAHQELICLRTLPGSKVSWEVYLAPLHFSLGLSFVAQPPQGEQEGLYSTFTLSTHCVYKEQATNWRVMGMVTPFAQHTPRVSPTHSEL